MTDSVEPKSKAAQPFARFGIAALARAPLKRLLLVQFIFALAAATTLVFFLRTAWFPTVREAIQHLPAEGEIRSGKLNWSGQSPQLLAEGRFLAFFVDTNHSGTLRSPAQIQIESGRNNLFFYSLTGYREFPYSTKWNYAFIRAEVQPWWGAWQPPILWLAFGGTLLWCMASWTLLATIYFLPAWLAGFFANRDLTLRQSWKLAGAALMPGALVMIATILLYGFGAFDLVQLAAGAVAHIVAGWIYLIWGVWTSPKLPESVGAQKNPFARNATSNK